VRQLPANGSPSSVCTGKSCGSSLFHAQCDSFRPEAGRRGQRRSDLTDRAHAQLATLFESALSQLVTQTRAISKK